VSQTLDGAINFRGRHQLRLFNSAHWRNILA
jgi:hypothetical protein